jgi:hypothetical protein
MKPFPGEKAVPRRAEVAAQRHNPSFSSRLHLFARHPWTAARRVRLRGLSRGLPGLRALRAIRDEVNRLGDRRCHTDTALAQLARLRRRVRRFRGLGNCLDRLHSPNREKALTFLDDQLLPATSNAVGRGNRRYRKMQKAIDRVRTRTAIRGRLAPDLQRDRQTEARSETISGLHRTRE